MKINIQKLKDNFGVQIKNFDCSRPLKSKELLIFKKAMQECHFICFKDQKLDGNSLAQFTKNFGDLEIYPEKDKTKGKLEIFNVSNISEDGEQLSPNDQRVILQKNNSRWHTDSSYRYYPASFSILYGLETLPPEAIGGQTEFSNMLVAYENLPEEKKCC